MSSHEERPEHVWIGGRCIADLMTLDPHDVVKGEYASDQPMEAWEVQEALEELHDDERPIYALMEVVLWADGTVPSSPSTESSGERRATVSSNVGHMADPYAAAPASPSEGSVTVPPTDERTSIDRITDRWPFVRVGRSHDGGWFAVAQQDWIRDDVPPPELVEVDWSTPDEALVALAAAVAAADRGADK